MKINPVLEAWDKATAAFWNCEQHGGFSNSPLDLMRAATRANARLHEVCLQLSSPNRVAQGR